MCNIRQKTKKMVTRSRVQAMQSQDPAGRFLQKDAMTGLWFNIGIPRALDKTSHALRTHASIDNNKLSSEENLCLNHQHPHPTCQQPITNVTDTHAPCGRGVANNFNLGK